MHLLFFGKDIVKVNHKFKKMVIIEKIKKQGELSIFGR